MLGLYVQTEGEVQRIIIHQENENKEQWLLVNTNEQSLHIALPGQLEKVLTMKDHSLSY